MSRNDFGKLYQEYYKTGIGAEVGTHQGDFAKILAKDYEGKILCIDIFTEPFLIGKCRKNLKDVPNCEIIKGSSIKISETIDNEALDWVYIDAEHDYRNVKRDINAWFPKVRKGGIVSGHDYLKYHVRGYEFGVIEAVDEFCKEHGYKIKLTTDWCNGFNFASWYFEK